MATQSLSIYSERRRAQTHKGWSREYILIPKWKGQNQWVPRFPSGWLPTFNVWIKVRTKQKSHQTTCKHSEKKLRRRILHSNKILLMQMLQPTTYLLTHHMSAERQIHDATRIQSHNHFVNKNSHFLYSEFYTLLANLGIIWMYFIFHTKKKGQERVMDSKSQVTFPAVSGTYQVSHFTW